MWMTLAAMLAAAAPGMVQDAAGNRFEPLSPIEDGERSCTADRSWCVEMEPDASGIVLISSSSGDTIRFDLETENESYAGGYHRPWSHIVRLADGVLIGVENNFITGFSGGGGQTTDPILIAVRNKEKPQIVLNVPIAGSFMIRACFSEKDMKQRAGACHDEYEFSGELSLAPITGAGMPVFLYKTKATSFPGHVSRSEDSLAAKRLRKKDLRKVTEPRCTYRRTFRYDVAMGSFKPDKPLPDCSDYTEIE